MSKEGKRDDTKVYWIIADGKFRTEVPENHPQVEVRHWEAGGRKGTKYERSLDWMDGIITEVSFYEGSSEGREFVTLNIVLDENAQGKRPVITAGIKTRYAEDMMKRLPGIDLSEEVRFRPFSFIPSDSDKKISGMTMTQANKFGEFIEAIGSAFHFRSEPKGQWKVKADSGFPVPEGDVREYDKDDWKMYFIKVNKFLVNYTKENIIPKLSVEAKKNSVADAALDAAVEESAPGRIKADIDDIDPDKIPW